MPKNYLLHQIKYMKSLEICERYFNEFGKDLLDKEFYDISDKLAVGLFGSGSECLGYDDEISSDHDLEPGFCIFIPGEDIIDSRIEFRLERAYAKLPKDYLGLTRSLLPPVGGERRGVIRYPEFFKNRCGSSDGLLTVREWLTIPEYSLLECVNGKVFLDNYGEVSEIRKRLEYFPEDIRLKKIAGNLLLMAQSGQYNYNRCIRHNETAAAQLAVFEFVKSTLSVIFLLHKRYQPYYKWIFRALQEFEIPTSIPQDLENIMTTENYGEIAEDKYYLIENTASLIIDELITQDLTAANCSDLEKHAYSVNDRIRDSSVRNLNILAAV